MPQMQLLQSIGPHDKDQGYVRTEFSSQLLQGLDRVGRPRPG